MSAFWEDEDEKEVRTKRIGTSISLPPEMLVAIDRKRGDVPRSKWIFRDLEKIYGADMAKIRKEMGH